jgi:nucleoside-diphosphate-sugar epimerase
METILVTGATGFVGRQAIVALQRRGFEVHGTTSSTTTSVSVAGVTMHHVDLFDSVAVNRLVASIRPVRLLHFAWYAEPGLFWSSARNLDWVAASLSLFRAFATHGGARIVVAGTCAEYEWGPTACVESVTPERPQTLYGISKLALQSVSKSFAEQVGVSFACGRIFFLYGPHENPARFVASVASALLRGEVARCTIGTQVRDFMHVTDCADAFAELVASDVSGVVNIASGVGERLSTIATHVAEYAGRPDLLRLGAVPMSPNEAPAILADVTRLEAEVGWSSSRPLTEGLRETVAWWQQGFKPPLSPSRHSA